MAKIKYSKSELKRQRDQLKQFQRFLPTLLLKKQQLQMELGRVAEAKQAHQRREEAFDAELADWIALFAAKEFAPIPELISVQSIELDSRNIAGIDIPVFKDVTFIQPEYDLFVTPLWFDRAVQVIFDKIRLAQEGRVLQRQYELLQAELRVTTQRVNLFEKVKIPETEDNIRRIGIYLGDQQTAAVGRAKIAKRKLVEAEAS